MRRDYLLLAILTLASSLHADEPTDAVWLKLYGHLPSACIDDCRAGRAAVDPQLVQAVLRGRTCGHPDLPDREIAEADAAELAKQTGLDRQACQGLIDAHQRMLEATGSGSFPVGCTTEYPKHHAVYYFVDTDSFPSHYHRPVTDEEWQGVVDAGVWGVETIAQSRAKWDRGTLLETALALVEEAYRRAGCAHIRVHTGPDGDHHIHVISLPIPGSVIGRAWYNSGQCSDHVNHHIDSTYRPGLHQLCNLLAHEFGHNNRLPHIFHGQDTHHGIMSYSPRYPFQGFRDGTQPGGLPRDPSWPQLTRQYGGEPVPPLTSDDPPPPPTGNLVKVGDTIELVIAGRRIETIVASIGGGQPPPPDDVGTRVNDALSRVADHPRKDRHRRSLAIVYESASLAVVDGRLDVVAAQGRLAELRPLLLGDDINHWSPVIAVANSAASAHDLRAVATALAGDDAQEFEITRIIEIVAEILPEGRLKVIVRLIIAILDGLTDDASRPGPVLAPGNRIECTESAVEPVAHTNPTLPRAGGSRGTSGEGQSVEAARYIPYADAYREIHSRGGQSLVLVRNKNRDDAHDLAADDGGGPGTIAFGRPIAELVRDDLPTATDCYWAVLCRRRRKMLLVGCRNLDTSHDDEPLLEWATDLALADFGPNTTKRSNVDSHRDW